MVDSTGTLIMILCYLIGTGLIIMEAFMPGFGIAGISGIILEIVAIVLTSTHFGMLWGLIATFAVLLFIGIAVFISYRSAMKGRLSKSPLVLKGEESGVHVFYAALSGADSSVISAEDFETGETKKALKGGSLQFPATKERMTLVIAEESPVALDNGLTVSRAVKFPGAGSSKYRRLKMTVEGACELRLYALSSLPSHERRVVLCNSLNGQEVDSAMVPAFESARPVAATTLSVPAAGTYYVSVKGDIPIAPVSAIMNYAVMILLLGLVLALNGVMLRVQRWERMKDLFFVEPALLLFLLFVYYPVIDLIRISFTNMSVLTTGKQEFVGFANFDWMFNGAGKRYFWESLKITGVYMFWEVTITLVGGMLLALLFNRMTRAFNAMRAVVFMPKYIAVSTSAVVFQWILYSTIATGIGQSEGILNYALSLFGIQGPHWLIDADTALSGVLILTGWRVVGYAMMIYLSAMKGISQDYYEAAAIDGADGVQRFRFITVPLLAPTTLFLFVTTFIASMKVFQSVDVMTGGGPGTSTNVMVQWIYNLTFKDFHTARGAAVSLVFFIILLVCTAATMRFSNRNVSYDA